MDHTWFAGSQRNRGHCRRAGFALLGAVSCGWLLSSGDPRSLVSLLGTGQGAMLSILMWINRMCTLAGTEGDTRVRVRVGSPAIPQWVLATTAEVSPYLSCPSGVLTLGYPPQQGSLPITVRAEVPRCRPSSNVCTNAPGCLLRPHRAFVHIVLD